MLRKSAFAQLQLEEAQSHKLLMQLFFSFYKIFFWRDSHSPHLLLPLYDFSKTLPRAESQISSSSASASVSAGVPATHQYIPQNLPGLDWDRNLPGESPASLLPKKTPIDALTAFNWWPVLRFKPRLEIDLIFLYSKDSLP